MPKEVVSPTSSCFKPGSLAVRVSANMMPWHTLPKLFAGYSIVTPVGLELILENFREVRVFEPRVQ